MKILKFRSSYASSPQFRWTSTLSCSMATKKRSLEFKSAHGPQRKKAKVSASGETPADQTKTTGIFNADDEVDFPRGGGSSFTPLEYKLIRAEAMKEADQDMLFKVCRSFSAHKLFTYPIHSGFRKTGEAREGQTKKRER